MFHNHQGGELSSFGLARGFIRANFCAGLSNISFVRFQLQDESSFSV